MSNKMTKYEYWEMEHGTCFSSQHNIQDMFDKGIENKEKSKFIYAIDAATFEEACAIKELRLGRIYSPIGDPTLCPNNCGMFYWPKGSGICPLCGFIE
jgi:hypothetical protein